MFYLVPNLVQDIHRVFGHHNEHPEILSHEYICHDLSAGIGFNNQSEECPICVFEFNVLEEPSKFVFTPVSISFPFILSAESNNQLQNHTFLYYNLRAPPGLSVI